MNTDHLYGQDTPRKLKTLTAEEKRVIIDKGTERPFTGKYDDFFEDGVYTCKQCGAPLYRSGDKFASHCGWPSFDDEIPGAVKHVPDADGQRTEIICNHCGAHLGHVFSGEGYTAKNVRHCVNSISLQFLPADSLQQKAYFAGGCFWGVEYYMQQAEGVLSTTVGYMGGTKAKPTYEEVCAGNTGYLETVQVVFDPRKTSYEKLAKLFFEIHDPTQTDGQGPDIGQQYVSAVFYANEQQKEVADKLIGILKKKGFNVATSLRPAATFWKAENYHQDYYKHHQKLPYCHTRVKRF